jgi:HK97 family phage portal protein
VARRPFAANLLERLGIERKGLSITGGFASYGLGGSLQHYGTTTYGRQDRTAGWDMDTVIEGYERSVWVYKAVEVISSNAARMPFKISNETEEADQHPLLRVMNKKANPLENGRAFRKRLSAQVLLSKKGAFVEVTKSRSGAIVRLDLLDPSRVRVVPDNSGDYINYFEHTRPDGEIRPLAPERVRWVRDNHPFDPFSGMTPLEAAGMSIELDELARLYNISFIKRDGRPGGILGIDADGVPETELERIAKKLKAGPAYAGEIIAVGTGPGGLKYEDTSSRPRDMAYETTSEKAKKEILAVFGVPESKAGDSSGRSWDNADQEDYNFWMDPMLPHLDLVASAFDGDVPDDMDCGFDTSTVDALELPARRDRQEAREEWDKGLRSLKEYREVAKLDVIDNPHTRALWISPTKAPVATRDGDEAALGMAENGGPPPEDGGGAPPVDPTAPVDPDAAADPAATTAQAVVDAAIAAGSTAPVDPNTAEGVVSAALNEDQTPIPGDAAAAIAQAAMQTKTLESTLTDQPEAPGAYEPDESELHRTELSVAAALDALLARQLGVVTARMESPKVRAGTPYWEARDDADPRAGTEPIDTAKVVDAEKWANEVQETLMPLVQPAATESANNLLAALAAAGALTLPPVAVAQVAGRTTDGAEATAEQIAQAAALAALAPAALATIVAVSAMKDWLEDRTVEIDALMVEQDPSLPVLLEGVRQLWDKHARPLVNSLALTVAQTAVLGGRDAAVEAIDPSTQTPPAGSGLPMVESEPVVDRIWRTRHDERVRKSHRDADGQVREVNEPFNVGGFDLRFPSDPLAPASQARGCRCWLRYEWPPGARFTLRST